jgi:FkbM family methyltransferase
MKSLIHALLRRVGYVLLPSHQAAFQESQVFSRTDLLSTLLQQLDLTALASDPETRSFLSFLATAWEQSNSQFRQDLFVLWQLQNKTNGRYIEIGGADGITHSNTLSLRRQFGWAGILVEPDPLQFGLCRRHRPAPDVVLNRAISPDGSSNNVQLIQFGQLSSLAGYHQNDVHGVHRHKELTRNRVKSVRTIDINKVFRMLPEIDYFSLDVEGSELDILSQISWDNVPRPRLCTIEVNDNKRNAEAITQLMAQAGYELVLPNAAWLRGCDLWFRRVQP